MKMTELIRLVGINMRRNTFRVLLTSLGIIVGTVTIILVIAIGQGGEQQAAAQFSGLSADTIYVNLNYQVLSAGVPRTDEDQLTPELIGQIMEESTAIEGIYLRTTSYAEGRIGGKKEYLSLAGVTGGYAEISNLPLLCGADFSEEDYADGRNLAVIGYGLAEKYFARPEDALGKFITLGKMNYRIIGVLCRSEDGLQGLNPDDTVFLPYQAMMDNDEIQDTSYRQMVGKARGIDRVDRALREIESTLRYRLDNSSIYKVEDAGSRIEAATASARNMKMLLISVAAIVFLVSGIGIMNVLFVTIKERTREIGILGALGMRRVDLLMQFLLESMSMGMFGGAAGVALSTFALEMMRRYSEIPVLESVEGKLAAFAFAVLTGTVFGFYPAYKAARMKPVDALADE